MSGVVLRDADWRDIPAMVDLERTAFPDDPWTETSFWAELAGRPRRSYLVAVTDDATDGTLVGQAGLDLAGEVADVMTLAVDPAVRGEGVGSRLLSALHERAVVVGARRVLLEVRADNDVALRLYLSHGYEVVHTRRGYYRSAGRTVDALVLRKELVGHG